MNTGTIMHRASRYAMAMVFGSALAACVSAAAKADVVYSLDFQNSAGTASLGTGTLDLNLASVGLADNLNQTLASLLVSITTTTIDGLGGFTITPTNLVTGTIATGNTGQISALTAVELGHTPLLDLDLATSTWTIRQGTNGDVQDQGLLVVAGPTLAVPGPIVGAGLPGLIMAGAGLLGFWRRKRAAQ
jgi:hypothetical protein